MTLKLQTVGSKTRINESMHAKQAIALSDIYKNRAEFFLNKIAADGGPSPDKVNNIDYFNARVALVNSVEFQQRCVRNAIHQEAIPIEMKVELMVKVCPTQLGITTFGTRT